MSEENFTGAKEGSGNFEGGSLWTSAASGSIVVPSLAGDLTSTVLRSVREAVKAAEEESKRFEGQFSAEAMKMTCG